MTGTSRELDYDNGWGYWQLPWEKWVKGSALRRPVGTARLDGTTAPVARPATPVARPAANN